MKRAPLLWHLVRQDLLTRYAGSVLGTLWLFANPLAQILIFTLVFGNLIGPRIGNGQSPHAYGFYLMAGVLPWTAFSTTVSRTAMAFLDKAGIIGKVSVGLRTIVVHYALAESVVLTLILSLLIAVMAALGRPPGWEFLWLPLLVVFQQGIGFAIGLAGAILTVFVRDIKEVIGIVMMVWMWMTPIVYSIADVNAVLRDLQRANPAYWFVAPYQKVFVSGGSPDLVPLAAEAAGVAMVIAFLLWLLGRYERDIRDLL